MVAAIGPAGSDGVSRRCLPKGRRRAFRRGDGASGGGGRAPERTAARSESWATCATGPTGRASGSSRSVCVVLPRALRRRPARKPAARVPARGRGDTVATTRRRSRAPRLHGEREMAREAARRGSRSRAYDRRPVPAFALNFYSPVVEAQLNRKTATIRLGDTSRKYQKGMVTSRSCAPATAPASTSSTRSSTRSR